MNNNFLPSVIDILTEVSVTQKNVISRTAEVIKESIVGGGVIHAFGSGHSHMMVEELFYRAGGLVAVNPIFDPNLMLHKGGLRSTGYERRSGYAEKIMKDVETQPGEPIIIVSHSGINTLPVEMAEFSKRRQLNVIAITSPKISNQLSSRAKSGNRLLDVADIVIDNCIKDSELAIKYDSNGSRVGAFSTIVNSFIIQSIVIAVADKFVGDKKVPPIFMSSNLPGGDEWNKKLISEFKSRVDLL